MQDENKISPTKKQTSSNNSAKVISVFITFILSGIVLAFATSYRFTYYIPIPKQKNSINSDTLNIEDLKILEEKIDAQKLISDSINIKASKWSKDLNENTDSANKKEAVVTPTKKEVAKKNIETKKGTSTETKIITDKKSIDKTTKKNSGGTEPKTEEIGNGRKLIKFVPGTMGIGGSLPKHKCNGSGTIVFSYLVDKNGHVLSVNKKSGTKNTCLTNTGINWIKQYVKANSGTKAVSGNYTIVFK